MGVASLTDLETNTVNILIRNSGHLPLLDFCNLPFRIKDEAIDIFLAPQPMDGGASCVSRRRTKNGDRALNCAFGKEILEKVAQELQCNVFESKSWPME